MPDPTPVTPAGGSVTANQAIGAAPPPGVVNASSSVTFSDTGAFFFNPATGAAGYDQNGNQVFLIGGPAGGGSISEPSNSGRVVMGVSASFVSLPSQAEPGRRLKFPDPEQLKTLVERRLSQVTSKRGIASFTVFDNTSGTKQYKTASFFAEGIVTNLSSSFSVVKTNRGFTVYSPDQDPTTMALAGKLLTGDDWGTNADPSLIAQTDWLSKFLSDYSQRLSMTAGFQHDVSVFFSFEDIYAEVFLSNLQIERSSMSPTVSEFQTAMIVKELRGGFRPDIAGSGPDAAATPETPSGETATTSSSVGGQPVDVPDGSPLSSDGTVDIFVPAPPWVDPATARRIYGTEFNAALQASLYPLPKPE